MNTSQMKVLHFEFPLPESDCKIEAVSVECGKDLIIVIGGGSRYHLGSMGLTISMPSLKDKSRLTNSTYQVPVPGHKEEKLAREASYKLSRSLERNVLVTVGIHEDNLSKDQILAYVDCFDRLVEQIEAEFKKNK